jgi:hypothetical protein
MAPTPTESAGDAPASAAAGQADGSLAQDQALEAAPASGSALAAAGTQTAPASDGAGGLATPGQIVELADQLSACADQIHERVMREIRAYAGGPVPDPVQATARALLEDEVLLRQRANGLYADAATFIVRALGKPQAQLVKLTADAAEKIRKIGVIGEVTSLVGGLLALAGAAATGQAVPVLVALDKIHKQVKAIEALAPKPPAKAG